MGRWGVRSVRQRGSFGGWLDGGMERVPGGRIEGPSWGGQSRPASPGGPVHQRGQVPALEVVEPPGDRRVSAEGLARGSLPSDLEAKCRFSGVGGGAGAHLGGFGGRESEQTPCPPGLRRRQRCGGSLWGRREGGLCVGGTLETVRLWLHVELSVYDLRTFVRV